MDKNRNFCNKSIYSERTTAEIELGERRRRMNLKHRTEKLSYFPKTEEGKNRNVRAEKYKFLIIGVKKKNESLG